MRKGAAITKEKRRGETKKTKQTINMNRIPTGWVYHRAMNQDMGDGQTCETRVKRHHTLARGFLIFVNLSMNNFDFPLIFIVFLWVWWGKIDTFDKGVLSSAIKNCKTDFSVIATLFLMIWINVYPRGTMWEDYGGMAYRGEICKRQSLGVDAVSQ